MNETLLIFSLINWVLSVGALSITLYNKYTSKADIDKHIYEAKAEVASIEPRLEKYFGKLLQEQLTIQRELSQNDALDLIKSIGSQQSGQPHQDMGMASFRNF